MDIPTSIIIMPRKESHGSIPMERSWIAYADPNHRRTLENVRALTRIDDGVASLKMRIAICTTANAKQNCAAAA